MIHTSPSEIDEPENMVKFNLDESQMADFRASIYESGEDLSPDEIFRKS